MKSLYLLKYKVPPEKEGEITETLQNSGTVSFAVEIVNGKTFFMIYSQEDKPSEFIMSDYLESIDLINPDDLNNRWVENYKGAFLTDNFFVKTPDMLSPEDFHGHVITLDPVGSFGDGCHATTKLCGVMLEDLISPYSPDERKSQSMLDIGTGSGILAIEAAMLGVEDIDLFDCYRISVVKADENLKLNGINNFTPFQDDLYTHIFRRQYNIITANLLTSVIEDNLYKMRAGLAPGGNLIISGIGEMWTAEIEEFIKRSRFKIERHKVLEGWNGFMLSYR